MNLKFYFFMLMGGIIIASCNRKKDISTLNTSAGTKIKVMEPFRFHKLMEVSPGEYYDILSWGRASVDTGAFMILHSDSSARKYTTTTGDLEGKIVDVYNSDMDVDGNPEIIIQTAVPDTNHYTVMHAFEFNDNNANKLEFPKLTESQRNGYRGGDNFYIAEGKLIREFPIYDANNSAAKLTGAKRKLEYDLNRNSLSAKQISKDSTKITSTAVKQETSQPEKKEVKKATKKKTVTKKKRRRHRN